MAKSRRAPEESVRKHRPSDDDETPRRKASRQAEDDEDDEEEGDDGPQTPRRKRKSAAGPARLVLRICAGVLGAILLFVVLYWVYSPIGTDHALLCYFPPETVTLSGYDANEASRNAKLKDVHETLISNYKVFGEPRFNDKSGVTYTDVDKYMSGRAAGDPEEEKDLPPDSQERRGSLTVIRFNKEIDPETFSNSFTGRFKSVEMQSRDGRPFYRLQEFVNVSVQGKTHQELKEDISYFFPTKRILVYATTQRELEEAMKRQSGRIAVTGNMRELADKVDGLYFQASVGWSVNTATADSRAFDLSFVDSSIREQNSPIVVGGTASWFASNGNDFLYASARLYGDYAGAKDAREKLAEAYGKAQAEIYGNDSGKPGGLEDPFNPKPKGGAAAGGFGGGGSSSEQSKDILEALGEYTKYARVRRQGRLVIVEGTISHGMPEQGKFEKFWAAVGSKYKYQRTGFGGGGFGGGPMAPGPMPGPMTPGPIPGPGAPPR